MFESMVFYANWSDMINMLPAEIQGETYKGIIDFATRGVLPKFADDRQKIIFGMAQPIIENNLKKRAGGKLGGRPRGSASKSGRTSKQNTYAPPMQSTMETSKVAHDDYIGFEGENLSGPKQTETDDGKNPHDNSIGFQLRNQRLESEKPRFDSLETNPDDGKESVTKTPSSCNPQCISHRFSTAKPEVPNDNGNDKDNDKDKGNVVYVPSRSETQSRPTDQPDTEDTGSPSLATTQPLPNASEPSRPETPEPTKPKKTRTKKVFTKPSVDEIKNYCLEKAYTDIDPERFFSYYEQVGWVVGKSCKPMKSWKAALTWWHQNNTQKEAKNDKPGNEQGTGGRRFDSVGDSEGGGVLYPDAEIKALFD